MQQRAHRRRRHHGSGQPAVQRYHGRLDRQAADQQREDQRQQATVVGQVRRQTPLGGKGVVACQAIQQHDPQQQHDTAGQGVTQVHAPCRQRLGRARMHYQRVSRQRQQFIEDQEGKQVTGERNAQRAGHAEAEKAKEAFAVGRMLQVANGIHRGAQPKQR